MDMRGFNKPSLSHASWSDRLNTSWTCGLFLLLSIVTWLRQYVGPNAVCVTPETSAEQLNKYFDNTCWLSRQILLQHDVIPFHNRDVKTLPLIQNENRRFENMSRSLYQWVPVILVLQAIVFRIPYIFVKVCDDLFGIRFSRIMSSIDGQLKGDWTKPAEDISQFLDQFLRYIIRYLNMSDIEPEPSYIVSFTNCVLRYDGFLVLEAIGEIYSDVLVRDIVINLWNANYTELQPLDYSQESLQVSKSNTLKVPFKESRITLASPENTPLITRRCFKV
ncbi:inx [Mytilus edulis]|uniref:Innexin n=1 Tax=Mytilus edulis TaxID=6550 RepID=A0A8S3PW33_MYTED|nr:inx [Mytilus edulis]